MVAVTIEDDVSDGLQKIGASIEDILAESVLIGEAADVLLEEIRASVRSTFRNRTGRLERSFSVKFVSRDGANVAAVVSDAPYAKIQNTGGTILPRRFNRLFLQRRRGGGVGAVSANGEIFATAKRVTLRGTGYLDRAAERAAGPVSDVIGRGIGLAIDEAI